jgi:hypothetical protein
MCELTLLKVNRESALYWDMAYAGSKLTNVYKERAAFIIYSEAGGNRLFRNVDNYQTTRFAVP